MDPTKEQHQFLFNSQRLEKARRVKRVRSMLIICFDIKGIVHKEFILWTIQSISRTTVMFYGDCMKMCEDFALNFGDKKNWLLHHDNVPSLTFFFHQGISG
jgi:hypothetical protein